MEIRGKCECYKHGQKPTTKIRCKCDWYQHGEKLTKLFLSLEKAMTPDLKEINAYICKLYKHFLKKNISKSDSEWDSFLNSIFK